MLPEKPKQIKDDQGGEKPQVKPSNNSQKVTPPAVGAQKEDQVQKQPAPDGLDLEPGDLDPRDICGSIISLAAASNCPDVIRGAQRFANYLRPGHISQARAIAGARGNTAAARALKELETFIKG